MNYLRFITGSITWHLKAGFWYVGLGFRLYFAIGLDSRFEHGADQNVSRGFQYPAPRTYREYLNPKTRD